MSIQNLTLEQISAAILFIVALYGGVKYLKKEVGDFLDKLLDAKFNPINNKLDDMQDTINKLDVYSTKNFLVRYLGDIERGDCLYDVERQRFWEEYDHYIDDLGENSFIKEWVAKLKDEGKLIRKNKEE